MSWVWRELAYNRASAKHPSLLPSALDSSLDNLLLSNSSFLNTCLFQRKWNPIFFCFHLHSALGFEAGCISDFKEMGRSKTTWGLVQTEGSQGTLGPAIRSPRLLLFKEVPQPPDFCPWASSGFHRVSVSQKAGAKSQSQGALLKASPLTSHNPGPPAPSWARLGCGGVCVCVCVCVCACMYVWDNITVIRTAVRVTRCTSTLAQCPACIKLSESKALLCVCVCVCVCACAAHTWGRGKGYSSACTVWAPTAL